ncbi:unnamed protein product [marine sediment metagenome]|uniref:Uncharacterized protein n=1 Tax=marine sediment metagenome TaxID=412755 RepID=X1CC00_9ZZZZ
MKTKLFADAWIWEWKWEHEDEFKEFGCGPGGVGDFLVPDTVWGLSITNACRIHDTAYRFSDDSSEDDRAKHDRILKNNSLRIVDFHTKNRLLKRLRYRRVQTYYQMVRAFGSPAYWSERNKAEEMQEI